MPGHGHEKGSGPGGTSTDQGERPERGGEHEQFALGYADRADPRSREASRVQNGAPRKLRECSVAHLQRHEQTAVPAGGMGETHPTFYVVATGGSGTSAQGWLERTADSLLFPPFHRSQGRYRIGDRHHCPPKFSAAGWRGHDIRQGTIRTGLKDA